MDVERYLLSSALEGIVSQKLARMLCPKCRKLRPTTSYEKVVFKKALNKDVNEIYDVGDGHCDECRNGYKGRIAIHEVLLIDDYLRDAINDENLPREELRKMVYTENVTTLLQDGLEKVLAGYTNFNEIYKLIEIDDELDSHYSDEMLGSKVYEEAKAKEAQEAVTSEPPMQPVTPTQAQAPTSITTKEDELGKTEILDLGSLN